jgi:molecular chaperone GrpE (heat shock protein)
MEAIVTQNGEEGKVIEEVRAGYMLYDSVLRPAQVIVGKKDL